ncbi:kelch-like protein 15 [Clavelina lepadiformis]|uniref:kelch-like protein 15 n=1 Tax=Clavelina lepadiformis TaxID=159417 RepID=UPI004040FD98
MTELRRLVNKWVSVDGVLAPKPVPVLKFSRRLSTSSLDSVCTCEHSRDPFHSVVELHGSVYVVGGTRTCEDGCRFSRSLKRYDPRTDSCAKLSDMHVRRGDFVACTSGEQIYVFGGRNRHGIMDICERYDPSADKWEFVSKLPEPTYMAAGVPMDGNIYLSGGFGEFEAKGAMFRYNTAKDEWTKLDSNMMAERGYHVMLKGADSSLWVIGGVDNPFSGRNVWEIEAFDTTAKNWQLMGRSFPNQLFDNTMRLNGLVDENGDICVFAVTDPDHYPKMKYSPRKRTWSEIERLSNLSELDVDT